MEKNEIVYFLIFMLFLKKIQNCVEFRAQRLREKQKTLEKERANEETHATFAGASGAAPPAAAAAAASAADNASDRAAAEAEAKAAAAASAAGANDNATGMD